MVFQVGKKVFSTARSKFVAVFHFSATQQQNKESAENQLKYKLL